MKSGSSSLVVAWGFAAILAIIFVDFKIPEFRNRTEFYCSLLPAAKLAKAHSFEAMYHPSMIKEQLDASRWTPPERARAFQYPPICSLALVPLLSMDPAISLLSWQGLSLFVLAYCVFLIGKAASRIDAPGAEMSNAGWFALTFLPTLLGLWSGNGDIIFGVLPLTAGYYFAMTNRLFLSGIFFSLCFFKPPYLLPAFVTALALLAHKRPRCIAGMIFGLPLVLGANALLSMPALMAWWHALKPDLHPVFAIESARSIQDYIGNVPQSVLMMIPVEQVDPLLSLIFLGAGSLAFLALYQVSQLARSLKEEFVIAPLAFITGLYLIPLVVPGVSYCDLSILVLAGLVIFSLEWRTHSDWRLKSTVRVTAISVNAFALLVFFQPKYAYPLILMALLIIYFRRLVEAVHLAASEHGGIEKVYEEEFVD